MISCLYVHALKEKLWFIRTAINKQGENTNCNPKAIDFIILGQNTTKYRAYHKYPLQLLVLLHKFRLFIIILILNETISYN